MRYLKGLLGAALMAMLIIGCSSQKQPGQSGNQPTNLPKQESSSPIAINSGDTVSWAADGVIRPNEYANYQKLGELDVYTRVAADVAYIAIAAQSTGWISIGIDPEASMKGADIIMGAVVDNKANVVDMYSTGLYGPHPLDIAQGGANDVTEWGGTEINGVTSIEFKRKLNTGDKLDKSLKLGDNKVIWSVGETDDLKTQHRQRGEASLLLR